MIKRVASVLFVATLLLGLGSLAYQRIFQIELELSSSVENEPNPSSAGTLDTGMLAVDENIVAKPQIKSGARVLSVTGDVQIKSATGDWVAAKKDAELFAADTVRTAANGQARLQIGKGVEVRVGPASAFSVEELREGLSRIQLKSGRVLARVDEKGRRVLQVQGSESDAVAQSAGGQFGVVASSAGELSVASIEGKVAVSAQGKEVVLLSGEQTKAMLKKAPEAPTQVPSSIYLKLDPLKKRHTNQAETIISGETNPGALIQIGNESLLADKMGKFRLKVPLNAGRNQLSVRVKDPIGRTKEAKTTPIMVDQKAPGIDTKVRWED